MNRRFSKEDLQTADRHMTRSSTSLRIREIQNKTTMRYHLTLVRVATTNNAGNYRCWRGCGERGARLHYRWECQLVQPLWKTAEKVKSRATLGLSNCTTRHLFKWYKNTTFKGVHAPQCLQQQCPQEQNMEKAQMFFDRWMDKEEVGGVRVYLYVYKSTLECYLAIKKNEILPFPTMWMELEDITLNEISQSEEDKYHMISFMCGFWAMKQLTAYSQGRTRVPPPACLIPPLLRTPAPAWAALESGTPRSIAGIHRDCSLVAAGLSALCSGPSGSGEFLAFRAGFYFGVVYAFMEPNLPPYHFHV